MTTGVTVVETEVADHAKTMLRLNDTDPARVKTVEQEHAGATPLFMVCVDYGWAETILASDAYAHHAQGLALAVAALFDCEYDVTATADVAAKARS